MKTTVKTATAPKLITIDGTEGEGGGQMLRSSLALSTITGIPFHMTNIRARRRKPGLMRQHLAAVRAVAEVGAASVSGDELHSQELHFKPPVVGPAPNQIPRKFHFAIGTAGSTTLVLQSVLPVLLMMRGTSVVTIEGGTYNPMAPPFDFLQKTFVPQLRLMGAQISLELERPGFAPAGGGRIKAVVEGTGTLGAFHLNERGAMHDVIGTATVAGGLSGDIARRELNVLSDKLHLEESQLHQRTITDSIGPGNMVTVEVECDHITEYFSSIGELGKSAERVASQVAAEAQAYLASTAPVGSHLADQLLLPMALGKGGSFTATGLSGHAITNIQIIQRFLPVKFDVSKEADARVRVEIRNG